MGLLRRGAALGLAALTLGSGSMISAYQSVSIEERARGADRVVVAVVAGTHARYERNEFGDEVIVTHVTLRVEEALKGRDGDITLAVEGGTVDGVTMRVSSLPVVSAGDRGVFFLTPGPNGEFRPHLRGQGILQLDQTNQVRGSSLTLDEVRRLVTRQGR